MLPGGDCRRGQLTEVGVLQASALGKQLRQRYESLVDLDSVDIFARTTNVARCIATLSVVLGGFLPPSRIHAPVPAATVDSRQEYM